jgi:predicted Zn-dependent peptidase
MVDHSVFTLSARNQRNQTLDEVKNLLFEQLELLKKGEFPDWLMEAAINNLRLQEMRGVESYRSRAALLNMAFLNLRPFQDVIGYLDRLSSITKEDVVEFANKHLRNDNYVVVYKRQGQPNVEAVEKPAITPIHINRDAESPLLTKIKETEIEPVEPVFIDFENDVTRGMTAGNLEIFYAHNAANPTFSLAYRWEKGSHHDRILSFAGGFVNFLGTSRLTVEEIGNEFYKLACSFNVSVGQEQTTISVSGLSENMVEAIKLLEELIFDAQPDEDAWRRYVESTKKTRQDSKAAQQANFSALVNYATFGENNPSKFTLTDEELDQLSSTDLISALQNLWAYEHHVVFFGPESLEEISEIVLQTHKTPKTLKPLERVAMFEPLETKENKVYFAHYDANQSYLQTIMKGKEYDMEMVPLVRLFSSYFGGGMNAIVFQEMREKRGLAYTARSSYASPSWPDQNYIKNSFIATQNDKVVDAFTAFNDLFDNMPVSETSFNLAQEQLISNIRTQRIRDTQIIYSYLSALRMGHDKDPRMMLFNELPSLTLDDVVGFNVKYIKDKPKTYVILGDEKVIDFEMVEKLFGPVTKLSESDLFVF